MSASAPSFSRDEDPRLNAPPQPGILLVAPGAVRVDSPFTLSGRFVLAQSEQRAPSGTPHRDLVLSVHREPFYACAHPFRDCLVFRDDVLTAGELRIGWFTVDAWSCCEFRLAGRYFVRVSLGTMISPVCEVAVE